MTDPIRRRPPAGSVDGDPLLLRLPAILRAQADRRAAKEGLSLGEWIRQAMRDRLEGPVQRCAKPG